MEATSTGAKEPNHLHGKKVKYVSRNVKKKKKQSLLVSNSERVVVGGT